MLIEIPLILIVLVILYVTWKRGGDIKNIFLLVISILSGVLYLFLIRPFSLEEEVFILFGSGVVMFVVAMVAGLVQTLFGSRGRISKRKYLIELQRKSFHFVALLMYVPWGVYQDIYYQSVLGFNSIFGMNVPIVREGFLTYVIFLVAYALVILFAIIEALRLLVFPNLFVRLLRPYEKNRVASYFYSTTAIFLLSIFMYPYDLAFAAALTMSFLADLAACLVGMKFRRFSYKDRSLEGGLANFAVGFISGFYFIGFLALPVALVIAVFDFLNGALEINLNDNLIFPLIAGSTLRFLMVIK